MRPTKYRKDKIPIFIQKLHKILSDQDNEPIIRWTEDNDGFIILDLNTFTREVLPKYFKHSNYNSFVRQLNMYSFNKIRYTYNDCVYDHVFQNQFFTRDNHKDFKLIRRKETITKCQSLISYNSHLESSKQLQENQLNIDHDSSEKDLDILEKLKNVKEKQEKLQEFCFQLISQNRILLSQNQQLAHKVKKQSKKKQRVLDQVFRIIGVSIAEFWDQFCQDTQTLQEKTNNFKQIYQLLMNYIQKNDLSEILKTLQFFIAPEKKVKSKIFKVVNPVQEVNFISNYTEQQVEQFISQTNIILEEGVKSNFN